MNWFNIVNFILALAPQEVALVKAIVDAAHEGHQAGTPLQPVQPPPTLQDLTNALNPNLLVSIPQLSLQGQYPGQPAIEQKETPSAVAEPPANGVKKTL